LLVSIAHSAKKHEKRNGLSAGDELKPFSKESPWAAGDPVGARRLAGFRSILITRRRPPIEAALFSWRQPRLGHRVCDDVTLNPCALRASKGSQVLVQRARLDRRQFHWRTASRALRTLILCVEHAALSYTEISPQFGARKGLERHRSDTVCSVTRSVRSHVTQSKVQRSKPAAAGLTQASTMGALHLVQRRESILFAVVETGNDGVDAGTRFPCVGRERYTPSHR
jgi:hypothetical protein